MSLSLPSLRQQQRRAILRILSLSDNTNISKDAEDSEDEWLCGEWKVLIYDKHGCDIIAPLIGVSILRKHGVTLHMMLHSKREPIPDVPAVYFCDPNGENIQKIAEDCAKRLYPSMHLNFITHLDRTLMEDLAKKVVESNSIPLISKVMDQYLDFVALEDDLFSLSHTNSFVNYNDPSIPDQEVEANMRHIAYGLLSVFGALGRIPIIRCQPGGAAEMVARFLCDLISDALVTGNGIFDDFSTNVTLPRPLLVIFDRTIDMITPLHHCSTYQALIDDMLDHRLNQVSFNAKGKDGVTTTRKTHDLNVEKDAFYVTYKGCLFPEAIEANEKEIEEVLKKEKEIRSRTSIPDSNRVNEKDNETKSVDSHENTSKGTKDLAAAVESLPQLSNRKKGLEMHTSILQAVMDVIATREIPNFFEFEEAMVSSRSANKKKISALLQGPGSLADKLRLIAIYILSVNPTLADVQELEQFLQDFYAPNSGSKGNDSETKIEKKRDSANSPLVKSEELEVGLGALTYIRKHKSLFYLPSASVTQDLESKSQSGSAVFSNIVSKATSQATDFFAKATAQVGQMLSGKSKLPVTRILDNLCEMRPGTETETYLYLDPKIRGEVSISGRSKTAFRDAIAFVIGGGCYSEFQNIQDYCKSQPITSPRIVTYGCTEMLKGEMFLAQLSHLGIQQR